MAVGSSRVRLDLNSPEFQDVFFRPELWELKQVVGSLRRLAGLDWNSLYRHTGFKWEPSGTFERQTAPPLTRFG